MKTFITIALVTALAVPAMAGDRDLLKALASVIASEKVCGLEYDQEAIKRFINEHVKADDMQFASLLGEYVSVDVHLRLKDMSQSMLTAHCTQIRRVAESYGFLSWALT